MRAQEPLADHGVQVDPGRVGDEPLHLGQRRHPGPAGEPLRRGQQPAVLGLRVVAVGGERAAGRRGLRPDPGEPRPELGERAGLVRRGHRLPGGERAVAGRLVARAAGRRGGAAAPPTGRRRTRRSSPCPRRPRRRPAAPAPGAPGGPRPARAARPWPARPCPGTAGRAPAIGGAAAGSSAASRPTVPTPTCAQRGGRLPAHHQADVLVALQLGLAARPPRAVPALGDPGRLGQRGRAGRGRGGHRPPVGEPGVVLGQRGALPRPGRPAQVVPGDHVGVQPDHAAVLGEPVGRGRAPSPRRCSMRCRWASRSRSRGCERNRRPRVRPGVLRPRLRHRRGERPLAGVGDPVPDDDDRQVAAGGTSGPAAPPRRGGRRRRRRAAPRPRSAAPRRRPRPRWPRSARAAMLPGGPGHRVPGRAGGRGQPLADLHPVHRRRRPGAAAAPGPGGPRRTGGGRGRGRGAPGGGTARWRRHRGRPRAPGARSRSSSRIRG